MTQDARGRRTHPSRGGLFCCHTLARSIRHQNQKMRQEFIIGERQQIDHFAKKNRWRVGELASWLKPDGTVIHYLRFPETVADLEEGSIVHVLGVDGDHRLAAKNCFAPKDRLSRTDAMAWCQNSFQNKPRSLPGLFFNRTGYDRESRVLLRATWCRPE